MQTWSTGPVDLTEEFIDQFNDRLEEYLDRLYDPKTGAIRDPDDSLFIFNRRAK